MSKKIWHCLGHGGSNHGCRHNGIYENNWVLQMAYDCGPSLMVWGLEVEYSRYEDLEVSYKDSAHNAKDWGADLAICHSSDNGKLTQFLRPSDLDDLEELSKEVRYWIQADIDEIRNPKPVQA